MSNPVVAWFIFDSFVGCNFLYLMIFYSIAELRDNPLHQIDWQRQVIFEQQFTVRLMSDGGFGMTMSELSTTVY